MFFPFRPASLADFKPSREVLVNSFKMMKREPNMIQVWGKEKNIQKIEEVFGVRIIGGKSSFTLVVGSSVCRSGIWRWWTYREVQFYLDSSGWVLMTYSYFDADQSVPVLADPLAGDSSKSRVVVVSAMGSAARPRDCANEVLGPGIYRMHNNGTCSGVPIFSKRAANIDSDCTDRLWAGMDVKNLAMVIAKEKWFSNCLKFGPVEVLA